VAALTQRLVTVSPRVLVLPGALILRAFAWLLVDKHAFYPKDFAHALPVVYEDGRYALYRVGAG
jgi:hypothetical protein